MTRTDLLTQVSTNLPTNTTNLITAAALRQVLQNMINALALTTEVGTGPGSSTAGAEATILRNTFFK